MKSTFPLKRRSKTPAGTPPGVLLGVRDAVRTAGWNSKDWEKPARPA